MRGVQVESNHLQRNKDVILLSIKIKKNKLLLFLYYMSVWILQLHIDL